MKKSSRRISLILRTFLQTSSVPLIFLIPSCAVLDTHQAKLDQQQLRDVLMDYTEDQILDNLIRAYNGRAIVHFDLSNVTSSVTSKITPNAGGGRSVTDVSNRAPTRSNSIVTQTNGSTTTTTNPANQTVLSGFANTATKMVSVAGGIAETVAKPFTWGIQAERDNAIGVQVDPVLDQPTVYAAYIQFLNTGVPKRPTAAASRNARLNNGNTPADSNGVAGADTNVAIEPPSEESSPQPTTTPTGEQNAGQSNTVSAAGEEPAVRAAPPPKKPKPTEPAQPPTPVDLVLRDFLSIKSLQKSPPNKMPSADCVLLGKKWSDGMYYWVPIEYRRQFFELCIATVVRGSSSPSAAQSEVVKQLKQSNAIERQRLLRGP